MPIQFAEVAPFYGPFTGNIRMLGQRDPSFITLKYMRLMTIVIAMAQRTHVF